jgi:signal transduction histidine kinase
MTNQKTASGRRVLLALALLGTTCPAWAGRPRSDDLHHLTLSGLEQRRAEIDTELARLASYSIRSGTGAIGYRSLSHDSGNQPEWIQIDFKTAVPLDEVVLIPVVRRDAYNGFQADGFPQQFRLIAGIGEDRDGTVIAEFPANQHILPRMAPLVIPCNGIEASWIRVEAEQLSLRAFDGQYVFELSEIMAFSGQKNVALHRPVQSKSDRRDGLAWAARFVVDGFTPYLMDAATGEKSVAFISQVKTNTLPVLTLDLGESRPVSSLHLHAVDLSDVLPQALSSDFGIPHGLRLEGSNQPDFSDAVPLLDLQLPTLYDMAPVMLWDFPESTHRYFRLTLTAPASDPLYGPLAPRFGFAEIELLSDGKNVALGRPVTLANALQNPQRPATLLTDGRNMYGAVLPIRSWIEQLAHRHDLETERPRVDRELTRRYEQQKANLRRLGGLSALLAAGIAFTLLIDRLLRMRQVANIRERFAADLHDELGANLHTIGLLSDLAEGAKDSPEELHMLHQRIRSVTERTGTAVRHCANMLEAGDLYIGLKADMQRAAERTMANLEHNFSIKGEDHLTRLNPRARVDLFLFYKECLVNISRHSGATEFSTRLIATPKTIELTITDNGLGLEHVPASLKRRAHLLGAKVSVERPAAGGACITLRLRNRKKARKMNV